MMESYVYIVECADKTLYTGWTNRPVQRLAAHNAGKGAKYTRSRKPVKLVYLERLPDRSAGLIREAQIKKLTAEEKRRLVESCAGRSQALYRLVKEGEAAANPQVRTRSANACTQTRAKQKKGKTKSE